MISFGIIVGSIIGTGLVSILKGKIKILMIVSAIIMAAGKAKPPPSEPLNPTN